MRLKTGFLIGVFMTIAIVMTGTLSMIDYLIDHSYREWALLALAAGVILLLSIATGMYQKQGKGK